MLKKIEKNIIRIILAVILVISYFLPWFYASEEFFHDSGGSFKVAMNGLGQGYMSYYFNSLGTQITIRFSWDAGMINLIGLILSILLLILYIIRALNVEDQFLKTSSNKIIMLSLIFVPIFGILYVTLFLLRVGNITIYILGMEITKPLIEYNENESSIVNAGLGYGFFLFIISIVILIVLQFLGISKSRKESWVVLS